MAAKAASPRSRWMFWPAVSSSWPAWPVEMPPQFGGARCGGLHELLEQEIEIGDLCVERLDASR
jgi:hypothetical protein